MTERLYYDDAYLTHFEGNVTACVEKDSAWHVQLDRSAFYPTSGGQPYDTGRLGDANVQDVYVSEDGDMWHVVDKPMTVGAAVVGEIDWPRRFDHMQQHAGDHMIASALWRHFGGVTIGLHISGEVSTIDVAMPEGITHLSPEAIRDIEMDVNERIQRDVPVRCWFPDPDELKALPLRKLPTVSEHVRIVAIGTDEMVACGGTHPSSAGQLGLVKIVSTASARGKMRVSFLAGMRAFRHYRAHYTYAQEASNLLSTGVENLPVHVNGLIAALKKAELELGHLRRDVALTQLEQEIETAPMLKNGSHLLVKMIGGDANLLKDVASQLIKAPTRVVLLGAEVSKGQYIYVFARSKDVDIHMGKLLSETAKPLGGKGGGRPDFAQGGGTGAILDAAKALITDQSL